MEIENITFSYNNKAKHLDGISGKIDIGKITTIIGPNGCGKSTLLGVLSNHHQPQHGKVILDGKNVENYKPKQLAKKLAVVHQENKASPDMTVERIVSYGRIPYKSMFSSLTDEDKRAIEWALSCTNLIKKRKKRLDQLSGGERQRVWIAMSLAQETSILFLDEPTTYLDIYFQYEILELIKRLNVEHGLTIVMVLHDINQAIRYSDMMIVMQNGKVMEKGAPEDVVTAELIRDIYGVQAVVKFDKESGLHIVPTGISFNS
ncbi:ABC transporter ATP-binding protein [Siminovitchia sp. FSL H7-0308]|uniref:ABC transporter ATP-binding protein n=1 Tax=Siminovitchia sp. FSL H7-0308 TaxID=2921432 RepID=UPI0030ED2DB1